ncbi:MAG: hypothetical protein JO361_09000, partial [Gammaproteobacteria bacterium]|nr:hypothetical protein [Gammaproteobacteria bacterium]
MKITRLIATASGRRGHLHGLFLGSTVVAAGAAALLTPSATRAADNSGADTGPAAIEEVIVTATRREERLLDVPVSTAVLSGAPLEVLGTS